MRLLSSSSLFSRHNAKHRINPFIRRRDLVTGRASLEGTKQFVLDNIKKHDVHLYHQLHASKLYASPIIHGPPLSFQLKRNDKSNAFNEHVNTAIFTNRSNVICVYDHKTNWHCSNLSDIFSMIPRDQLILVAMLGPPTTEDDLEDRLKVAKKACDVEHIDIGIASCDSSLFERVHGEFSATIETLEKMSHAGKLQCYGLAIDVGPFVYHTPSPKDTGPFMTLPSQLEHAIQTDHSRGDLMLYQVSPSTAFPATYPLLDTDDDGGQEIQLVPKEGTTINSILEKDRKLTRVAVHPLRCRSGIGSRQSVDGERYGPNFESSEAQTLNMTEEMMDQALLHSEKGDDMHEAQRKAKLCESLAYEGEHVQPVSDDICLVTGVCPEGRGRHLAGQLDQLCPKLKSSTTLQEKSLRSVFSIGFELALVDATCSASMGKLMVRPSQMLHHSETESVFGTFSV